ncbi:sulfotransferase family protein [Pseudomonas panipatensis]|uniref:Sulfotransferase family protein n=1 Tax=Pseudomonas panipatensis TaxID=428992 RepID=A0A1G8GRE2_9PSED|nr:sulfotransferase family protein [Pseudomonas panipatensis]SDH96841.1 hypothetical protein SAMN05216272_104427 [Pseudomonas panipatensis]SMP41899.1 hypothetical protein SAMN06295951_101558 [Pseudomonas panipatensis]
MEGLNLRQWLPIRAWHQDDDWRIDWCWFADRPLREAFFQDSVQNALRLPVNQALRRETPIAALLDWQRSSPGLAPRAFIQHASRCGSTLLAQMLASLDSHLVLSEPPPLDSLLRAQRLSSASAAQQRDWLAALLSAYGQPRRGEQALVIKLDAWNIFEAEWLRAIYPQTPWLFVYREPLEIVASHLRQPGRHMVPGLIGPSGLDQWLGDAAGESRASYVARCTGAILQRGLEECRRLGGIPLNYNELPGACWGRLADVLGISAADLPRLRDSAGFDSKHAGMAFRPDGESKRASLDAASREQVERWARAPYLALERLRLSGQ